MAAAYPEDGETEATREGTASHELAEALIAYAINVPGTVTDSIRSDFVGASAGNRVVYTHVMYAAAWEYTDDLDREVKE